jgi:vacuolar-type H+-ATPase subunit F/Vma7
MTFKQKMGKSYIAMTVGFTVMVLIIGKFFIHKFNLDFIALNTLIGSVISSSTFIAGFLLAGVFSDYKEVEKIPAEIRSSLESILSEGKALKRKDNAFDDNQIKLIIKKFVKEFEEGLSDIKDHSHMEHALESIDEFDLVFDDMEKRGVPPNYMTRIKTEQSQLRKMVLRVYHIQKTRFIPSVSVLVESIVLLVILLLAFAETDLYTGLIELGLISYLLIYTMQVIHVLEKPFRKGQDDTCDDVSIFLLRELSESLNTK